MANLGDRLKLLRKEKGLKQVEIVERFNQSPRAYQYYESAAHYPEIPDLIKLADFFGVSTDYLLGRSQER